MGRKRKDCANKSPSLSRGFIPGCLREALLKNNNIGVIKSLKLMNFKCKNNLRKYSRSRSTFRNKFDPSLELLLLRYFRECKCILNEIHSFAEVSKRRVFPFIVLKINASTVTQ